MLLKQSTARNVSILMVDSSDHITGKTGLSAGLTIYATKDAGTPATITPTVTELDATNVKGLYNLALTTTHTNTLGELQLHITGSGADPTDVTHQVVTALPGEWPSASDIATAVWAAGTRTLTGFGTLVSDIVAAVWNEALSGHTTSGTAGKALSDAGAASDPWATALPGAYGSGTAGKLLSDAFNAADSADTNASSAASAAASAATSAASAASSSSTVEGRLTSTRAGYLDNLTNLDDSVSSRLAASGYTAPPSANDNADALLDRTNGVESSWTLREAMRIILSALGGIISGAGTTTIIIRDVNDSKNRIEATVDEDGNRTAVTLDAS
jgi:hypothetical protein